MFYATRTLQVAAGVNEVQALSFYTKAQRDGFCNIEDATPITAAQRKALQDADVRRAHKHPQAGVFFVQRVLP